MRRQTSGDTSPPQRSLTTAPHGSWASHWTNSAETDANVASPNLDYLETGSPSHPPPHPATLSSHDTCRGPWEGVSRACIYLPRKVDSRRSSRDSLTYSAQSLMLQ